MSNSFPFHPASQPVPGDSHDKGGNQQTLSCVSRWPVSKRGERPCPVGQGEIPGLFGWCGSEAGIILLKAGDSVVMNMY